MFTKHLKKLNSKGIAHVIVPMLVIVGVGIAGAGAMVATHANAKKKDTGYLMVFSEGFSYQKVKITSVGQSGAGRYCGSKFDANGIATKNLSPNHASNGPVQPTFFRCSATSGDGKYDVTFINVAGGQPDKTVAIDVNNNQCTFVHPDPAKTSLRDYVNGKCVGPKDTDTIHVVAAQMTVKPQGHHTYIGGYVGISEANTDFQKYQCTGSVKVTITPVKEGASPTSYDLPLKHVGKSSGAPHQYCVASLSTLKSVRYEPGVYTVAAQLSGSKYFTAAPASAQVTIEAKTSSTKPATTTAHPTTTTSHPTTTTTHPGSVTVTAPQ